MQRIDTSAQAWLRPSIWSRHLTFGKFVLTLSVNRDTKREQRRDQLANRLVALRRERGLSRAEVAERLHIHPSTLVAMENGNYQPSVVLAMRLSELFELPIEAIYFSSNKERFA